MIKFLRDHTQVLFSECPNEISLVLSISNCQFNCKGCHSAFLREDIGEDLNTQILEEIIEENIGISAVVFLGNGNDDKTLINLFKYVQNKGLKTCLYTAHTLKSINKELLPHLNYIKTDPYSEKHGGIDRITTNQHFYSIINGIIDRDITYMFQKKHNSEHIRGVA